MEVKSKNLNFTEDDIEFIKFYIHLYPGNITLEEEENLTATDNQISLEIAREELHKQLQILIIKNKIKIVEKLHDDKYHHKYILLTDETKNTVWKYMDNVILDQDPSSYIHILRKWISDKDENAKKKYDNILYKITKKYNRLLSLLMRPITKRDILQIGSVLYNYQDQNDPILKEILNNMEAWLSYGLIIYNEEKKDENIISYYKLSEDGLNAIKLHDKLYIQENHEKKDEEDKKKTSVINKIEKNDVIFSFMILFFISTIIVSANVNNLFGVGAQTLPVLSFIIQITIIPYLFDKYITPKIIEKKNSLK